MIFGRKNQIGSFLQRGTLKKKQQRTNIFNTTLLKKKKNKIFFVFRGCTHM